MKVRNGFVSNSSSSSFIVFGEQPKNLISTLLPEVTARRILNRLELDWDLTKCDETLNVWMTEFISDDYNLLDNYTCEEYSYGGHGGPHLEDDYIEIEDRIWVLNEDMIDGLDDTMVLNYALDLLQMSRSELVNEMLTSNEY